MGRQRRVAIPSLGAEPANHMIKKQKRYKVLDIRWGDCTIHTLLHTIPHCFTLSSSYQLTPLSTCCGVGQAVSNINKTSPSLHGALSTLFLPLFLIVSSCSAHFHDGLLLRSCGVADQAVSMMDNTSPSLHGALSTLFPPLFPIVSSCFAHLHDGLLLCSCGVADQAVSMMNSTSPSLH